MAGIMSHMSRGPYTTLISLDIFTLPIVIKKNIDGSKHSTTFFVGINWPMVALGPSHLNFLVFVDNMWPCLVKSVRTV